MNKIALILALISLGFSAETPAIGTETVHDNFKPAGLQIDGSGWFRADDKAGGLSGRCGFFIWDGVQFSTTLGSNMHKSGKYSAIRKSYDTVYYNGVKKVVDTTYHLTLRDSELYAIANLAYFWGYKRGKTDRLVHSVGIGAKIGYRKRTPLEFKKDSGEVIPPEIDKILRDFILLPGNPYYQLFWFVTPTIAPNVKLEYDIMNMHPIPDLSLGFSYFIPSKKLVLIHRENKERRESKKERRAIDESTAPVSDSIASEDTQ